MTSPYLSMGKFLLLVKSFCFLNLVNFFFFFFGNHNRADNAKRWPPKKQYQGDLKIHFFESYI